MMERLEKALAEIEANGKLTEEQKLRRQASLLKAYKALLPADERKVAVRNTTSVGKVFGQALGRNVARALVRSIFGR